MDIKETYFRDELLNRIDAFRTKTGVSNWRLGLSSVSDHKIVKRLETGGNIYLGTADRILKFMEEYKSD